MVVAAILGTVNVKRPDLSGFGPEAVIAPGDDILLQAEDGHEQAVNHVVGAEDEADGGIDWDVEVAVVALELTLVGEGPSRGPAVDHHVVGIGGLDHHVDEAAETIIEDDEHQDGGDDGPGEFEGRAVSCGGLVRRGGVFAMAVLDAEPDQQEGDQEEEKEAEVVDEIVEPVHVCRDRRGLLGHPEGGEFQICICEDRCQHSILPSGQAAAAPISSKAFRRASRRNSRINTKARMTSVNPPPNRIMDIAKNAYFPWWPSYWKQVSRK